MEATARPPKSAVPRRLRVALPALVAADVALLVVAQLLIGASTEVSGEAPLGLLEPHTASEDNLPSAARRLWGAQAWALVGVVVGLSGFWPYVKLFTTLLLVGLADVGRLGRSEARLYLLVLEGLGKYSFADVFLICCNCVIFNISTGGKYRILALFRLELDLWMQLHFASVALIMAVTFSAFLTHWAVFELSPPSAAPPPSLDVGEEGHLRQPLLSHHGNQRNAQAPASTCKWKCAAAISAALLGATLLCLGLSMPLVTVDRGGFLGRLIRPEKDRVLELSVWSICSRMLTAAAAQGGNMYSAIMVSFLFALTFAAPLLEFALLAADAAARALRSPWSHRTHAGAEWAHSFGCVDVLLIVAVALVFELHRVVSFNLGAECEAFASIMDNGALLTLAGLGFAASPTCFDPSPRFARGSGVMLAVVAARFLAWRCNEAVRAAAKGE